MQQTEQSTAMGRPDQKGPAHKVRALSVAALLVLISMLTISAPAQGAFDHSVLDKKFTVPGCASIVNIAVLEPEKNILVLCGNAIRKFDYNGEPVNFSASGQVPYVSGNMITGNPGAVGGTFGENSGRQTFGFAVDSSSANHGYIFVSGSPNLDIFLPSGEWAGNIQQAIEGGAGNSLGDVDVGSEGHIFLSSPVPFGRVSEYNTSFDEVERLYRPKGSSGNRQEKIRVDTTGAIWARNEGPNTLTKYEADQFRKDLKIQYPVSQETIEALQAEPSPFAADPLFTPGNVTGFDVDYNDDDVYIARGDRVLTYSNGNPAEPSFQNAPDFGVADLGGGTGALAVTKENDVFVVSGADILRFGKGKILPDVMTKPAQINDIGHTTATVTGRIELAGGPSITDCIVEYGPAFASTAKCVPDASAAPPGSNFGVDTDVEATLTGLTQGTEYQYRFKATNANGSNVGVVRTVTPAFVLKVQTDEATEIDTDGAVLNGSFDPDGKATTYYFEYGATTSYGSSTTPASGGSGSGVVSFGTQVEGLAEGKVWHYRIAVFNVDGTTYGQDRTFRTASPPDISGVRATDVTATGAIIRARINPVGFESKYEFQYGTTSQFGTSVPIPQGTIAAGDSPVDVFEQLTDLQPGITYHFRVVATNKWGTSESADTTFDFAPPSCPNAHVRQQTRTNYLPDCRAYELVSPENAGPVVLWPGLEPLLNPEANEYFDNTFGVASWPVNTGRANSPPRLSYWGGFGAIRGMDAPNVTVDMYMATRTSEGWVTTFPGLKGGEVVRSSGKQCSESLDRCIDHAYEPAIGAPADYAPFMFEYDGDFIRRLPTNIEDVPGGHEARGAHRMSPDFTHFVFSTNMAVFAPEGVTGGVGSVYDNDIEAETVELISRRQNGSAIPQDGPEHVLEIPGISPNGDHILIDAESSEGTVRLYMRVNTGIPVTYDVSRDQPVKKFMGMTRDGSKVLFVTGAPLAAEDTDTSDDLYMWQEAGDKLTVLSQGSDSLGSETGNTDSCTGGNCNVTPVTTTRQIEKKLRSIDGPDDVVAEQNGDTFFFSPEILDPSSPGIKNSKNLYMVRDGDVQLVSIFDPGTGISRMQISPDGAHTGLITASRMTSYDNKGFEQMYTYEADSRLIRCASCNPSGAAPTANVEGSQGGPFMTDDGRVFFATKDALVAQDSNFPITDVYEYVAGRPQLISAGTGGRDFTGGSETLDLFTAPVYTGLESVSKDGTDVYFSTYDKLVSTDLNGAFIKFYDARSGGGFPLDAAVAPCVAADECHGPDSSPPARPTITTGKQLGDGGNAASKAKKKKKKRKHRKKKKKHAKSNTRRNHG